MPPLSAKISLLKPCVLPYSIKIETHVIISTTVIHAILCLHSRQTLSSLPDFSPVMGNKVMGHKADQKGTIEVSVEDFCAQRLAFAHLHKVQEVRS